MGVQRERNFSKENKNNKGGPDDGTEHFKACGRYEAWESSDVPVEYLIGSKKDLLIYGRDFERSAWRWRACPPCWVITTVPSLVNKSLPYLPNWKGDHCYEKEAVRLPVCLLRVLCPVNDFFPLCDPSHHANVKKTRSKRHSSPPPGPCFLYAWG